ncbi:hypothetical protein QBC33DRAFT_592853 [Phialemonium atrogriseum]|uniref:Uncharacterized protein n=1 Tax=Phialemonium atrogriseum TaxID=1093897 RepID=A0AAJ0FR66_9PEZI|nr:uncharacterized protein QBC33DRAFT_592853 [Phialemonium atrogriseum]KAK1771988.1 hypothetical protein QBC33DRAFT_592853 [Phialemonium atrogriseum]
MSGGAIRKALGNLVVAQGRHDDDAALRCARADLEEEESYFAIIYSFVPQEVLDVNTVQSQLDFFHRTGFMVTLSREENWRGQVVLLWKWQKAPPNATTGEAATAAAPSEKYDPTTRLRSGANPRTKPTDAELAAKMEKMRILSAEKTRRFEQAQRDESDHAIAYARGMEEARKRRAAEEERRRRGEEDRRRMEDERAANRERKLRAMGQKEGGWDEGKEERLAEEDRRGFRGANGGVRGVRRAGGGGGGLAGSRYATAPDEPDSSGGRDFGGERGNRGRGRGRGGPIRGGRGGRGGFQDEHAQNGAAGRPKPDPPAMSKDDFPALPPADNTKTEDAVGATAKLPPAILNPISPLSPGIGGWDEEMAAIDAKNRKL